MQVIGPLLIGQVVHNVIGRLDWSGKVWYDNSSGHKGYKTCNLSDSRRVRYLRRLTGPLMTDNIGELADL
jgi:hypothetical protein